jgi:hypothetical protein
MSFAIVVAIVFVQLTGPDGRQRIDVNPNEITSLREPRAAIGAHFAKGTGCVIATTSGKLTAVHEHCDEVRKRIVGHPVGHGPCTLVCAGARS